MPSKGFQLYTYLATSGIQVKYSVHRFSITCFRDVFANQECEQVPGAALTRSQPKKFFNDHLEVDKDNLTNCSPFNFVGRFQFEILKDGKVIFTRWCEVNALTGNIVRGSDLREMEDQVSHVAEDVIVTYGMYDAGRTTAAGLPNSNQVWVTVQENQSKWMGALAPEGSEQAAEPFTKLVLPCAHGVGANSMQNVEAILTRKGCKPLLNVFKTVNPVAQTLAAAVGDDVLTAHAPNIIRGLAFNQKDSLPDMLAIGARYFEFRPAHLLKALLPAAPILDRLYFHHGPIPGMSFEQFLHDCVNFLVANPTEIIVVQLRWDNVPKECARPGDLEAAQYLSDALKAAVNALIVGNLDDMQRLTIEKLREQRKRLILFTSVPQYSSWNEKANATLDGASIVSAFDKLAASQPRVEEASE